MAAEVKVSAPVPVSQVCIVGQLEASIHYCSHTHSLFIIIIMIIIIIILFVNIIVEGRSTSSHITITFFLDPFGSATDHQLQVCIVLLFHYFPTSLSSVLKPAHNLSIKKFWQCASVKHFLRCRRRSRWSRECGGRVRRASGTGSRVQWCVCVSMSLNRHITSK